MNSEGPAKDGLWQKRILLAERAREFGDDSSHFAGLLDTMTGTSNFMFKLMGLVMNMDMMIGSGRIRYR